MVAFCFFFVWLLYNKSHNKNDKDEYTEKTSIDTMYM